MKYIDEMKDVMTSNGKTGEMGEKLRKILEQKRQFEEDMRKFRLERELARAAIDATFARMEKLIEDFAERHCRRGSK